jgi:hypothetical protein
LYTILEVFAKVKKCIQMCIQILKSEINKVRGNNSKARLNDLAGKHATLSILSRANTRECTKSDHTTRTEARVRLGMATVPLPDMPLTCVCNKNLDPKAQENAEIEPAQLHYHFLECIKTRRTAATRAHDYVVICLARWGRKVGWYVHIEHRIPYDAVKKCWPDRKIPDLFFIIPQASGSRHVYSDVSLHFSGCPTYFKDCAKSPAKVLDNVNAKATKKFKKYRYLVDKKNHASFIGASASRWGTMSNDLVKLARLMAKSAYINKCLPGKEEAITQIILTDIAVAIQKGNAGMIAEGVARSRNNITAPPYFLFSSDPQASTVISQAKGKDSA